MADEPKTPIQGKLFVGRKMHGAVQCIAVPEEDPENWTMHHFITAEEMFKFAALNNLTVEEPDGNDNSA